MRDTSLCMRRFLSPNEPEHLNRALPWRQSKQRQQSPSPAPRERVASPEGEPGEGLSPAGPLHLPRPRLMHPLPPCGGGAFHCIKEKTLRVCRPPFLHLSPPSPGLLSARLPLES